ncbi:hypothetical protein HZB00_02375 [Candidatus Woesearchaeota archaeon]|nr:hypothetical protein [Candidatus Woesearchaeota archaeon]
MQKRGQLLSQPFMAILALATIAFILFFGFYLMNTVFNTSRTVDTKVFQRTLENSVNEIYQRPSGSSKEINIRVPNGITTICFVDLTSPADLSSAPQQLQPGLTLLQKSQSSKNVFFVSQKTTEPLTLAHLRPQHLFCANTGTGTLNVFVENIGETVDVRA